MPLTCCGDSKQWMEVFTKLNNTLSSMQQQISDLETLKGTVSSFTPTWKKGIEEFNETTQSRLDEQEFKIKMLTNIAIKQEQKIEILEDRLTAAYKREIRPNLIVHGILEGRNKARDELFKAVTEFFTSTLEIEEGIQFNDAYRLGDGNARPVLIKLKYVSDKRVIFSNASKLQGKMNVKHKLYFLQDNMTEEDSEKKQIYRWLLKENKTHDQEEKFTSIRMNKGKIFVNNNMIKPMVRPPTSADTLTLSNTELENIQAVKLVKEGKHTEKGSDFYVYAAKAKSIDDVNKAYLKMRVKYGEATHISCGYQLEKPNGPYNQQGVDDKKYGCGRTILQKLIDKDITELAVFVARVYGGVHLGSRRFEIFKDMTQKATDAWYRFLSKKSTRAQRFNSQDSLNSLASLLSDNEATNFNSSNNKQRQQLQIPVKT